MFSSGILIKKNTSTQVTQHIALSKTDAGIHFIYDQFTTTAKNKNLPVSTVR